MQFQVASGAAAPVKADTLVVGVYEGKKTEMTASAAEVDKASKGALKVLFESGDFSGKLAEVEILRSLPGIDCPRIVVVGLGKKSGFTEKSYIEAFRAVAKYVRKGSVALTSSEWVVAERGPCWRARTAVRELLSAAYKTKGLAKNEAPAELISDIVWLSDDKEHDPMPALNDGRIAADAMIWARELEELPPNICDPEFLSVAAQSVASQFEGKDKKTSRVTCKVYDKDDLDEMGMGGILGVSRGSNVDPCLIELSYRGAAADKAPVVLVGKGVTFDAGGISLKPARSMEIMKFDMCGAAVVLAAVKAAAEMGLEENITALVPAVENLPSGHAIKPADVIRIANGMSVEVKNTDAEGRLILADALSRACELNPEVCIDVATLTGACIVALGNDVSGLFCDDEDLTAALACAADSAHDPVWPMPMGGSYRKALESTIADIANANWTAGAGACTAATFLKEFAPDCPWAHLDVAGTANTTGVKAHGTARPLPLILEWFAARNKARKAACAVKAPAKAAAKLTVKTAAKTAKSTRSK